MPLASGYLKATADADSLVRDHCEIRVVNLRGGAPPAAVVNAVLEHGVPDVLACSVQGWSFRTLGALAETLRAINPDVWIVFGGPHVENQAERVFRLFPEVDIVANGEGEPIFADLLHARIDGAHRRDLGHVAGVSFRDRVGRVVTTTARPRIADLDEIPSPFLSGAIPLRDSTGTFPYDVALMETNRGCPYRCAFCYWGGAVGERIRSFSRARLRRELALFGAEQVETIVLCDANFGMQRRDLEFIEDLIDTRDRFGFPRALETSWTKNKSPVFYEIVDVMRREGLQSSFTLALQSLHPGALDGMARRNMRLNEWEELADWLRSEGLACYAELIWGAPGETPDTFLAGYDRLAEHVSRIAVYPLLVLPNTTYSSTREQHGLITVRGDHDDYEYVVSNRSISRTDNVFVQRFLFWARTIAENLYFRHIWHPLRQLAGISQSEVLLSLADWFDEVDDPVARELRFDGSHFAESALIAKSIRALYADPRLSDLCRAWWTSAVVPRVPPSLRVFFTELYRYDEVTRPVYDPVDAPEPPTITNIDDEPHYVREVSMAVPVPEILARLDSGAPVDLGPDPVRLTIASRLGFRDYVDNHELAVRFVGRCIATERPSEAAVVASALR
jgi:radical SAM superfamily enzyme YgiQ (UPF0313 family)